MADPFVKFMVSKNQKMLTILKDLIWSDFEMVSLEIRVEKDANGGPIWENGAFKIHEKPRILRHKTNGTMVEALLFAEGIDARQVDSLATIRKGYLIRHEEDLSIDTLTMEEAGAEWELRN